jgi:hypothetical protein
VRLEACREAASCLQRYLSRRAFCENLGNHRIVASTFINIDRASAR